MMAGKVKVSICIPAYKRTEYLKRLLDSIRRQTYQNFEVIISDDSPDNSVSDLIKDFATELNIRYYKNNVPLGTPSNWNFCISKANGDWIKLMHDDDWFTDDKSLQNFVNHTNLGKKFIFSAYVNVYAGFQVKKNAVHIKHAWKKTIIKQPGLLLAQNIVGPPSVTLLHHSIKEKYDERLKWRVDMEYYIRVLKNESNFTYIDIPLVNVGISETQVTQSCIYKPEVELPEGYILLEKHGTGQLKNIWIYDAWWRLLRNMKIRKKEQLERYVSNEWPAAIVSMVSDLDTCPEMFLKAGISSKLFMVISYFKNFRKIKQ
ncbi:glycosyltransferase family 2 protein [Foetidibacter luteolus]|uniref:glycosyltransferase family 2 protein n=1 Tax=Foetidibacter luteolus TaxID=2608880 RepID=UPI00129AEACF|nr:glycosyltransferase family 2 protein [Foetidibacter luteolus]